jgi:hypothetical protein
MDFHAVYIFECQHKRQSDYMNIPNFTEHFEKSSFTTMFFSS